MATTNRKLLLNHRWAVLDNRHAVDVGAESDDRPTCRKVVGMHTAAPLVEGCGLNITLISHGDVMDLSVCVCPDNVPAVNDIATGIVDSVGILVAAAQESPRGERPSVLTQMTSHTQKRSHGRH